MNIRANSLLASIALGGLLASNASATIVVRLFNPAGANTTVNVGDVIHADVAVSTDNANGIYDVQTRLQTSINGGVTADDRPFHASLIPTNPANITTNQPVVSSFNSTLTSNGNLILAKATARFAGDATPNSMTGNEPLFSFTAASSSGSEMGDFYSPLNATQTQLFDVSFKAMLAGTVTFNFTTLGNGLTGDEYNADGTNTVAVVTPTPSSSFAVTINNTPEPSSIALAGVGAAAMLRRRRKAC